MNPENKGARLEPGAGGDTGDELISSVPLPLDTSTEYTEHRSDNGNSVEGYGSPAFRRARDLAIAGGMIAKHRPTARDLAIIVKSWTSPRVLDLDGRIFQLLIERTAPSPECADPAWVWALTCEEDIALIVGARLRDYLPAELVEPAAAAAAAVVFGRLIMESEVANAA